MEKAILVSQSKPERALGGDAFVCHFRDDQFIREHHTNVLSSYFRSRERGKLVMWCVLSGQLRTNPTVDAIFLENWDIYISAPFSCVAS